MMCAKLLKEGKSKIKLPFNISYYLNKLYSLFDTAEFLHKIDTIYAQKLKHVLEKRKMYALLSFLLAFYGLGLYVIADKEDIPYQDNGIINVQGHAPHMSTLAYTSRYLDSLDKLIREIPEIESYFIQNRYLNFITFFTSLPYRTINIP